MNTHTSTCPGCGVALPITNYPASNPYGVTSSECRQKFDEILVKEQTLFHYPDAHRLIIDAYLTQHPRRKALQDEQQISQRLQNASVQSIAIHLTALYCALELKLPLASIASIMNKVLTHMNKIGATFPELEPPHDLGKIRVTDVYDKVFAQEIVTLPEYEEIAYAWARSSWDAWQAHHDTIRKWHKEYTQR